MNQIRHVLYVSKVPKTTIKILHQGRKQIRKKKKKTTTVIGEINKLHSDTHGCLGDIA